MINKIKILRTSVVEAELAALARVDRPVLLAALVASSGLLLSLLCAGGAP